MSTIAAYAQNIARFNKTKLAGYVINGSTSESVLLRWSEVYRQWEVALEHAAAEQRIGRGHGRRIHHRNHRAHQSRREPRL